MELEPFLKLGRLSFGHMRRYELVPEPIVVWKDGSGPTPEAAQTFARIVSPSPDELVRTLDELPTSELERVVVALDDACQSNTAEEQTACVIALAPTLVDMGVIAFETRHVVAVNRVFETHQAISAATLDS